MTSKLLSLAVLVGLTLVAVSPHQARAVGDAGCGLGSLIFTKNAKLSQTLAVTTNGSFMTNLFGITSGTSNCSASSLVGIPEPAAQFAEANFESIKVDMARGSGETLATLGKLLGCSETGVSALSTAAQTHLKTLLPTEATTSQEMLRGLHNVVIQKPELKASCGLVG